MTKPLLAACGFAIGIPLALAQTPKPEVITHLNDLDIEVSAMGVPTSTTEAGGELVGIRAVKVMNNTGEMITCEFQVPNEARASTSAPPVFNVNPNSQRVERVPGEYSPNEPFAELSCRSAAQRTDTTGLPPREPAAEPPSRDEPASGAAEDSMRSRD